MPTITLIREPAAILVDPDTNVDQQADWESPSGRDEAPFPRLQRPAYVFHGPGGDLHWIGQGCVAAIFTLRTAKREPSCSRAAAGLECPAQRCDLQRK